MGLLRRFFRQAERPLTLQEAVAGTAIGAMLCVQSPTDTLVNAWGFLKEFPVFKGYDDFQRLHLIEPFAWGRRKVDAQFLHQAALVLSAEQRIVMIDLLTRFINGATPTVWSDAEATERHTRGREYIELVRGAFA